jgi:hypothetical protein
VLNIVDELSCQFFHGEWAELVSYSHQGAWRCTKPGCAAQVRHDTALTRARFTTSRMRAAGSVRGLHAGPAHHRAA